MSNQSTTAASADSTVGAEDFKVIAASSVGTIFEWFDFFLYGSMAGVISRHFFAGVNEVTAFTLALLAFAAGFAVRPFGALVFGYLGDLWGRKNTFLITLTLMGAGTFAVGLLPTYAQIGPAAPWILVALRMVQGLSVGGVYGGAAIYVAEHAPHGRRGFYTSWIQTTATVGMALSLAVIFGTREIVGADDFAAWGWRIPFLMSALLLTVTMWIQLKLNESPVYKRMKSTGKTSTQPWKDAFGNWKNLRIVLIALGGAVAGQAVIWYTAQFYVLFFLQRVLKVDDSISSLLVCAALIISTPLYVFFGWLTDKIGRKKVMMTACLLAALTYFPLFKMLTAAANPALSQAVASAPVVVTVDENECSFQFDPIGGKTFSNSCDIVQSFLSRAGVSYNKVDAPAGTVAELKVGDQVLPAFKGNEMAAGDLKTARADWEKQAGAMLSAAGYPAKADNDKINIGMTLLVLVCIMVFSAMVYGPMAALLVELFPAKIRYTSMSFPYHVGTGWLGGFLPTTAFAIVAQTGNMYSGLWYPLIFSLLCFVIGCIWLPETKDVDIHQ